jgi:hypothetical protein
VINTALTPAAAEALAGPFSVAYDDYWRDQYTVRGAAPGEDGEERTTEDERGRHDVRRHAIELLPDAVALLALARSLLLDADDRGELDWDDETSLASRRLLEGIKEVFDSINAAAAPHELELLDVPPEEFRRWLMAKKYQPVGFPDSPVLNPIALHLEEKHGGETHVKDGIARLPDGTKRLTLPYVDSFLQELRRAHGEGELIGPATALRLLDEVL